MSDPAAAVHCAALAALRDTARATAIGDEAARLPETIATCAATAGHRRGADPGEVGRLAQTYVFAARVGGAAADPDRAEMWLAGWSRARTRSAAEAHAAVVDGIRFAERLHRSLGIDCGETSGGNGSG